MKKSALTKSKTFLLSVLALLLAVTGILAMSLLLENDSQSASAAEQISENQYRLTIRDSNGSYVSTTTTRYGEDNVYTSGEAFDRTYFAPAGGTSYVSLTQGRGVVSTAASGGIYEGDTVTLGFASGHVPAYGYCVTYYKSGSTTPTYLTTIYGENATYTIPTGVTNVFTITARDSSTAHTVNSAIGQNYFYVLNVPILSRATTINGSSLTTLATNAATSYTYTGSAISPFSSLVSNGYVTVTSGTASATNVGSYSVTLTPTLKYKWADGTWGAKTFTWSITKAQISAATVTLSPSTFVYNGSAQTPTLTLKYNSKTLSVGTDYTYTVSNNTNVGTATVTITGTGTNFTGTTTATYTITAASISSATVTLSPTSYTYDGTSHSPGATVTLGSKTLTSGTDYTVSYSNNVNAGTATVTVTGTGNYKDTAAASFTINAASLTGATVTFPTTSYDYTGSTITPTPTVTVGGKTLTLGKDFTITYSENTNAGTAKATITGIGNYAGSVSGSFEIVAADLSKATITVDQSNLVYTGNEITPDITVTLDGVTIDPSNYTVSYTNNTVPGEATVTITATGSNFAEGGTTNTAFEISKADRTGIAVTVEGEETLDVFGEGATLTTTDASGETLNVSYTVSGGTVTVDANGKVTAATSTSEGEANGRYAVLGEFTVTATIAESSNYNSGTAEVTIKTGVKNGFTVTVNGVTTAYENLQDAVNAAAKEGASGTVTVVGNPTVDYTVEIPENASITIVGEEGATITRAADFTDSMFKVSSNASLTVEDLTVDGGNVNGSSLFNVEGALTLSSGATVQNGNATDGGAVYVNGGSLTVASGANLSNNFATNGGAVYVASGKIEVKSGAELSNNSATNGGAIYIAGGEADIGDGAELSNNSATDGGAVYIKGGSATIDGTLSLNNAEGNGGAVYVVAGAELEVTSNAQLTSNKAEGNGGAIYMEGDETEEIAGTSTIQKAEVTISGGTIANNSSDGCGNGVYAGVSTGLEIAGTAVSGISDTIGLDCVTADDGSETQYGQITITGSTGDTLSGKLTVEYSQALVDEIDKVAANGSADNPKYIEHEFIVSQKDEDGNAVFETSSLKSTCSVKNSGYTLFANKDDNAGLTAGQSKTEVAVYKDATTGEWVNCRTIQEAIDAVAADKVEEIDGVATVYLISYSNDDTERVEVEINETLTIPDGCNIAFASAVKVVHTEGGDSSNYDYVTTNAANTVLKRGESLTDAMIVVENGAELTLENVTLDGGAIWGENGDESVQIIDDGAGGAGTVTTNNTGVTAHAPVIVNQGTLNITDGAIIQNNDNNYAAPGEGFGSQNYGGGVRNEGSGTLNMTGGTIQNCYSREGGAIMNVNKPVKNDEYQAVVDALAEGATLPEDTFYVYDADGNFVDLTKLNAEGEEPKYTVDSDSNGYAVVSWTGKDESGNVTTYTSYLYAGEGCSVTISGGTITGNVSQQKGAAIQTIYGDAATTITTGTDDNGDTTSPTITGNWSLNDLGVLSVEEGGSLKVEGGTIAVVNKPVKHDEYLDAVKDGALSEETFYVYDADGELVDLTKLNAEGGEPKYTVTSDDNGYAVATWTEKDADGNDVTYTSYLYYANDLVGVTDKDGGAVENQNAIYLFNQYSAADYEEYATTPFIEGVSVGELAISGSPEITGVVHIDDSCLVVNSADGTASEKSYDTSVNITGLDEGITVSVSDGYNGEIATSTTTETEKVTTEWQNVTIAVNTAEGEDQGDLSGQISYIITSDDGYTLSTGAYDLTFEQTEPGKLVITGTVDPAMQSITIKIGNDTYTLDKDDGINEDGTVDYTLDLSGLTNGEDSATDVNAEVSFGYGDSVSVKYGDSDTGVSNTTGLTENLYLVQFDSQTAIITVPEQTVTTDGNGNVTSTEGENTYYLNNEGKYVPLTSGLLPNDIAIDDDGNATFVIGGELSEDGTSVTGGEERKINIGTRAEEPNKNALGGDLYDASTKISESEGTNEVTITVTTTEGLEYAIATVVTDENGEAQTDEDGNVLYTIDNSSWTTATEEGYITFEGLDADTKYVVVVRTPAGTVTADDGTIETIIPSEYTVISGEDSDTPNVITTLSSDDEAEKDKFETAYEEIYSQLLVLNEGTGEWEIPTTTDEETGETVSNLASAEEIKALLQYFDEVTDETNGNTELADTVKALPAIVEKIELLEASYDKALAEEWTAECESLFAEIAEGSEKSEGEIRKEFSDLEAEYQNLPTDGAKEIAEDEFAKLIAEYVDYVNALISGKLSEYEDNGTVNAKLTAVANEYQNAVSSATTTADIDELYTKALSALELTDNYCDLIDENGANMTASSKQNVESLLNAALDEIKNAEAQTDESEATSLEDVLSKIVTDAEAKMSHAVDQGVAEKDYIDAYNAITGESVGENSIEVADVLAKIESATDVSGINSALSEGVAALVKDLLVYDDDGTLSDSAETKALVDNTVAALENATTAASNNNKVADLSAVVKNIASDVDGQRAKEKQAAKAEIENLAKDLEDKLNVDANDALINQYVQAAEAEIENGDYVDYAGIVERFTDEIELIESYDELLGENGANMTESAKAALKDELEKALDALDKAYESGKSGDELAAIVEEYIGEMELIAAKGVAEKDYIDAYNSITGESVDENSAEVADVLAKIESATDVSGINSALSEGVAALVKDLLVYDDDGTLSDSAETKALVDDVVAALENATTAASNNNKVADLSAVVKNIASEVDAQRTTEKDEAKAEIEKLAKALEDKLNVEANDALINQYVQAAEAEIENGDYVDYAGIVERFTDEIELIESYDELLGENGANMTESAKAALKDELEKALDALDKAYESGKSGDELAAIVEEYIGEMELIAAKGVAEKDYIDAYNAITGESVGENSAEVADVLAKIESATDVAEINSALSESIAALVKDLLVYDDDGTLSDSAETKALVDDVVAALEKAVSEANSNKDEGGNADPKVAELSDLVKDITSEVEAQRTTEKDAAKAEIENLLADAAEGLNEKLADIANELASAAKEAIDSADYADYELIVAKVEAQISVLEECSSLLEKAEELDGSEKETVMNNLISEVKNVCNTIDAADTADEVVEAEEEGILGLEKIYVEAYLQSLLDDGDSEQAAAVIESAMNAVENTEYDSSADLEDQIAAIYEIAENAEIGLAGERFMDDNPVLRKDFDDISSDDENALREALEDFAKLPEEVQDYLDEKAKEQGYSSFESLVNDEINKSLFEKAKEEVISQTEQLIKEHDGESVLAVLEEQKTLINSVAYEPCKDDDNRDDYAKDKSDELADAGATAKTEIEHAQAQQRTINSAIEELEEMISDNRYSDEQIEALQEIINELKDAVSEVISSGDVSGSAQEILDGLLADTIKDMGKVPVSAVITGDIRISDDGTLTTEDGTGDYGENNAEGVWGVVTNDSSIPSDVLLVIKETDSDVMEEIKNATNSGNLVVANGNTNLDSDNLADLISGKEIKVTLDVYLLKDNVRYEEFEGIYVVKVLMLSEWRNYQGLQVVYVGDDGTVEVYETSVEEGKYITFSTTHFSEFYILGEKEVDLLWLIILLAVLLVAEIAILVVIFIRKKNKNTTVASVLPIGLLLTIVRPEGAVAACIALGVCVVLAAAAIAVAVVLGKRSKAPDGSGEAQSDDSQSDGTQDDGKSE